MHSHLCGGPRLQIGILGIGQALDGKLTIPISAPPVWIGSHGRDLSRDWPKVEAGIGLSTEVGGHEVRNGGFLRCGSHGHTHHNRGDECRTAQQRHLPFQPLVPHLHIRRIQLQ
jgi:hypothetical protein